MTIDLDLVRGRVSAGERLPAIAETLGVPWQRLSKALRGRARADSPPPSAHNEHNPHNSSVTNASEAGAVQAVMAACEPEQTRAPLTERHRPKSLADLAGQSAATALLRAFAAEPYPAAFVFAGETGTGKTSAAVALAGELGCDLGAGEFGGVYVIPSGDQTAENVRDVWDRLAYAPWSGSGWRVLIVNEADRMGRPAENVWLDRLETIPARCVVIFTTNEAARLAQRFMDRCTVLRFESNARKLEAAGIAFVQRLWQQDTGATLSRETAVKWFGECVVDENISFRRIVTRVQDELLRRGASRRISSHKEA